MLVRQFECKDSIILKYCMFLKDKFITDTGANVCTSAADIIKYCRCSLFVSFFYLCIDEPKKDSLSR